MRARFHLRAMWRTDAIGVGVCLGLAALSYFGGIEPLGRQRAVAAASEERASERRAEGDRLLGIVRGLRQQLDGVEAQLAASPFTLEKADGINQRLAALTELATENELTIGEISTEPPEVGPRFAVVRIRLRGRGSYPACARFLEAMNGRFRDVGVGGFGLTRAGAAEGEGPGSVDFMFALDWYTDRDAAAGGSSKR